MTGNGGAPEGMWSSPQDLVGTILADRYQVIKVIGDGGMGSVFLAEHVTLRKKVALKVLHPELCRDQTHVDRFLQEARAASMINHENIVDIVDFGPVPGGSVFFAMEFLEGKDLSGTLKADGRMPWPRVQNFMLQIVRALGAAHEKGIIHRDLKPANCFVIVKPDGREFVKLLDFGIAKVTDSEHDKGLTRTGAVFGTAKYMAPEQACGEPADNRTDIYASAVLMYELLTGMVPFDGDNFMRVLSRHLTEPLTLPSTMAPDAGIPPMVESIVVKALSKKREDRYQSMEEFEQALLALGPDGTFKAGGMGAAAYSSPNTASPSTHAPERTGGGPPPPPPSDAKGSTMWLGQGAQANQGPNSQPPEGRGGTLLLDADSVPPDFMNGPEIQGPTDWSTDVASGGTMMIDGMGQEVLAAGAAAAAITHNPASAGAASAAGAGATSPETNPPLGSDPTYGGDIAYADDDNSRKGLLAILIGGGIAALAAGGLVAWLWVGSESESADDGGESPAVVASNDDDGDDDGAGTPDPTAESVVVGDPTGQPEAAGSTDALAEPAADSEGDDVLVIDDDPPPETETDPPPETETDPPTETETNPPPETRPSKNPRPRKPTGPVNVRSAKDLGKGFSRANKAAKACGAKLGAIGGMSIAVQTTIRANGEVSSAKATGVNSTTPLGKCVANAVKSRARFVASKQPLQIETRTYKM